ncbi:hypothetical protein L6R53_27285 [Myxococcota bacterium]|nr:hypothetical protein [Myxococcota bacterium]
MRTSHLPSVLLACSLPTLLLASACGDKDGDDTSGGGADGGATSASPCADPEYNALAGTCAETFFAGCFDPAGECDGTVDIASGSTTLTWANGATVETTIDYSVPTSPVANTTITSSSGAVCATGVTKTNFGGCASQTTYTRTSDGAIQIWCTQNDGSMEVVCPGGEGITVTAAQARAAGECAYGSEAEPCVIDY